MIVDVNEYKVCDTLSTFHSVLFAALSGLLPTGYDITNGTYNAFCSDLFGTILDKPMYGGAVYTVKFYSSIDPSLPNNLKSAGTDPIPWDKINYLINKYSTDSWLDLQAAVWSLVHGCHLDTQSPTGSRFYCEPDRPLPYPFPYGSDNQGCLNTVNIGRVQTIVADAMANGGSYTPGPGQLIAVVVDVTSCTGSTYCTSPAYLPFQILFIPLTCCSGSIGDIVWHDLNRNGIQDAGEPGIDGVTVNLKNGSGAIIATTTTGIGPLNQHGYYQFTGLCAGDYTVEAVTPAGFSPTTSNAPGSTPANDSNGSPASVNLPTDTSTDQTIDFGYVSPCTGAIGDFVWHDLNRDGIQDAGETGIDGVTVNLKDTLGGTIATTTTGVGPGGQHGYYQFTGLCAGDYIVEAVTPAGFSPTASNVGPDRTIDSNGSPAPVTLPADNSSDQTIDFGYVTPCTGSIGDFVWHDQNRNGLQDANEPGIDGVTVTLKDSLGATIATTNTAVGPGGQHGYYQFTGLCAGGYIVEAVTPSGFSPTKSNVGSDRTIDSNGSPAAVTLPADNSSDQTIDFGYVTPCTGAIGDFVWEDLNGNGIQDANEPEIDGVTVNLKRASDNTLIATTTTSVGPGGQHGYYQFTGLCAGDYFVEVVTPPGFSPTTSNAPGSTSVNDSNGSPAPVTLPADNSSDQTIDFGFVKPASLGDFIWQDNNANGVQDNGEPGIPGVTVTFYNCNGTPAKDINGNPVASQTTDANGKYLFTNLPPGRYYVVFLNLPVGYVFTTQNLGNDATDSDANRTTGKSEPCMTLASGETNLTVDAGAYKLVTYVASLGDRVWEDKNFNGQQDSGELGIQGVTVTLYNCDGTAAKDINGNQVAPQTTNGNGNYLFTNLPPGSYYVVFSNLPAGYVFTLQNVGADDATDSDANRTTGKSEPCVTLASGETNLTVDAGAYIPPPPKLELKKSADKSFILPGGQVTYAYEVKNTGGVTINNVSVVDDNGTPGDKSDDFTVGTIASLAPGASQTFTFTEILSQKMCMTINGQKVVVGLLYTTILPSGDIQVTYVQKNVNDNRYGTGATAATGWSRSQTFNNLVGSDKAQFQFTDSTGKVVLDFYVDYISSSSAFPSGYGSLGVSGGEGQMLTGSALNVLSATTSLTGNLKKSQFQTGYLVNSPPETAPLSGISIPAGWDYDNSYTVVVSKSAFGANGFGGVTIPLVHDSPPKIGSSNAITPTPCEPCVTNVATATGTAGTTVLTATATATVCFGTAGGACDIAAGDLKIDKNKMQLPLKNNGTTTVTLNRVTVVWPASNGYLSKVKLDGDNSWDGTINCVGGTCFANITAAQFVSHINKKSIKAGATRLFALEFQSNANKDLSKHSLVIDFGGGCVLSYNAAPPTCQAGLKIGDYVWYDANNNGIQDLGESPAPGVALTLKALDGSTLASATTGPGGKYEFSGTNVCAGGTYLVEMTLPAGYGPAISNAPGSTTANDSNPNPSVVTLVAGQNDMTIDFGLTEGIINYCPTSPVNGVTGPVGSLFVNAYLSGETIPAIDGLPWSANTWGKDVVILRYDQSFQVNDNTYGTGSSWGHSFSDLVGSDMGQFAIYDKIGNKVLEFKIDYISASASAPSGYASLGVSGGEGGILSGNGSWVIDATTSLDRNLNDLGYCTGGATGTCKTGPAPLLVNSGPSAGTTFVTTPNFSLINAYYAVIDAAAFGGLANFIDPANQVRLVTQHNSPQKVGSFTPTICK